MLRLSLNFRSHNSIPEKRESVAPPLPKATKLQTLTLDLIEIVVQVLSACIF